MNPKVKAIFYIIFSAFCFAWMNAFVRLAGDLPSVEKSFFRNLVAAFVALFILWREGKGLALRRENLPFHLLRAVLGTIGILCNFYAVDHLVLSNASILNKMSPFFVLIFSYLFLKEKLTPFQISAFVVAFAGSLFVVKPTLSNLDLGPSLIGLCSGIAAGGAYTMVRILGLRGERSSVIVLFFSVFSCVVVLPWLIFDYHPMSLAQIGILLFAGLSAAGGQFSITAAYCYAPAREISVYDYSQIIFSAGLGFFFFEQIPDLLSWIGYAVICLMAVAMFLYNNRRTE